MKALATFVRLVSKLLAGQEDFLEAFIEDFGISATHWKNILSIRKQYFKR